MPLMRQTKETINFECAQPLSCAAAREEIGVPRTDKATLSSLDEKKPSYFLPLRKGENKWEVPEEDFKRTYSSKRWGWILTYIALVGSHSNQGFPV